MPPQPQGQETPRARAHHQSVQGGALWHRAPGAPGLAAQARTRPSEGRLGGLTACVRKRRPRARQRHGSIQQPAHPAQPQTRPPRTAKRSPWLRPDSPSPRPKWPFLRYAHRFEPSESDAGNGIRMSKRAAEDEELEAGKRTVRCACGAIDRGRISLCSPISLAGQRLPLPLAPADSVS